MDQYEIQEKARRKEIDRGYEIQEKARQKELDRAYGVQETDFELVRRALVAFWKSVREGAIQRGKTPCFEKSVAEIDNSTGREYVLLKDNEENVCAVFRVATSSQLRRLSRIPVGLRTSTQETPFY